MCSSYFFSIKKEVVAVRISAYVGPQVQKIMFFFSFSPCGDVDDLECIRSGIEDYFESLTR